VFHLATLSLGLIVAFRFLGRLPIYGVAKYTLVPVGLLVTIHHLLSRIVFGTMFSPEVHRLVMVVVNWLFVSILLLALVQIAIELYRLVPWLIERYWVKPPMRMLCFVGLASLAVSAFGVSQALRVPPPKTVEIPIKGLPRDLDGVRILQLTDLHISRCSRPPG
jgi:hypothetical protein